MDTSKLQPALYGGILLGLLSALPIINVGNFCCCLWVIAGGVVAAYLLQNNQPAAITAADGAAVGLLAGLIGAVVWQVVALPISLATAPLLGRLLERVLANAGDLPDNVRPLLDTLRQGTGFGPIRFVVGLVLTLVVCSIFSTVGGLIGAAVFGKRAPVGPETRGPVGP
jgi:hypothetical protein